MKFSFMLCRSPATRSNVLYLQVYSLHCTRAVYRRARCYCVGVLYAYKTETTTGCTQTLGRTFVVKDKTAKS